MTARIQDIAQIQSGVYATPDVHGNATYLQVRHFKKNGELTGTVEKDLLADGKIEKHLLRDNDLLFMSKGSRNDAVLYNEHVVGPAVASLSFIVVRLNDKYKYQILPEYLSWFINHPRTQEFLKAYAKGSGIPSISLSAFKQLEVPIPPIKKQDTILAIRKLRTKERALNAKLDELKEQFVQYQLFLQAQQ